MEILRNLGIDSRDGLIRNLHHFQEVSVRINGQELEADDKAVMADSEDGLQQLMECLHKGLMDNVSSSRPTLCRSEEASVSQCFLSL